MRPQVGQVINNKYRLLRLIGDGGMGSVYEARHEVLGTSVALKFLHHELSRRAGLVQRFLQEARVSAQIQSPHVVRVTDVDQAGSGAFIVMEYLDGRTLQTLYEELYRAGQQLSYPDALEYAMQMLEGVEAAHKQGVVHRDLKPDNVMITADAKGRALLKLLDFGIAKLKVSGEYDRGLTRPGVIMGTPEYMAPEQAFSADTVDARADIFSLGVMIFEMLAGRRPVGGDEPQQIAGAYLSGRIAMLTELAPSMPPELGNAVHRAMAAQARDRWQSVTDFRDALEPFAVAAKAPSVTPRLSSLSHPGVSFPPQTPAPAAITPPATNVAGEPNAAAAAEKGHVPRTLPPAEGGNHDATNPADPPEMSQPKQRGPTPLGGFAPGGAPGPQVPPTKSVSPYVPEAGPAVDHGSTAFASPLAPIEAPSLDHSPRPSGTAIGEPAFGGEPAMPPPPAADPVFGGPARGPSAYTPPAPIPSRKKPQRGFWSSLPAILLLAAGITGVVVGGVYIAQSAAKTDEHEDPPVTSAPSATVASDPPPVEPPPPQPLPPATTAVKPPPLPPRKPYPPPRGSGQPNAPPAPSGQPSARPLFPIPIVIPSALPIPFFFGPGDSPPRTDPPPPRSRPDLPPRDDPPRRPQRDPYQQRPDRDMVERASQGPDPRYRRRPGAMPHGPRSTPDDLGLRD